MKKSRGTGHHLEQCVAEKKMTKYQRDSGAVPCHFIQQLIVSTLSPMHRPALHSTQMVYIRLLQNRHRLRTSDRFMVMRSNELLSTTGVCIPCFRFPSGSGCFKRGILGLGLQVAGSDGVASCFSFLFLLDLEALASMVRGSS